MGRIIISPAGRNKRGVVHAYIAKLIKLYKSQKGGMRRESSVLRVLQIELLGKSPRATMATMASELVGNQCRPDLLDAPITIIPIFIDSAAPAT